AFRASVLLGPSETISRAARRLSSPTSPRSGATMTKDVSRRDLLLGSAAALPLVTRARGPRGAGAPAVIIPPDSHPVVVAAATGFGGVQRAYEMITHDGDTLDA